MLLHTWESTSCRSSLTPWAWRSNNSLSSWACGASRSSGNSSNCNTKPSIILIMNPVYLYLHSIPERCFKYYHLNNVRFIHMVHVYRKLMSTSDNITMVYFFAITTPCVRSIDCVDAFHCTPVDDLE